MGYTWDNFDDGGFRSASDGRWNQSVGDFRSGGWGGGVLSRSKFIRVRNWRSKFFARRMEEDDQTLNPAQIDLSYYDQFGSLNLVLLNGDKLPDKQEVLKETLVEIFNSKKGMQGIDGFTISKSLGEIEGRHEELLNEA